MSLDNIILLSGTGTRWLQLFVSLSLLIVLHEFGHFWFAKKFKMRVEKFYLFFDFLFPISSLLNFSLFKKKVGDTEYGVGWFPLGGYVKIAGMVDESMDKEQLAKPPQPWEFRAKPAWQRLLTMLGGIIVNVITAFIIYAVVFSVWGEPYLPAENVTYGIETDSLGKAIGLQDGDKIVATNGEKAERWNQIRSKIIFDNHRKLTVLRNGATVDVNIPESAVHKLENQDAILFDLRIPAVVGEVTSKSEAEKMALKAGDSIISINGQPVQFYTDVKQKITALKSQPIIMIVGRPSANGQMQQVRLSGNVDTSGKIGFAFDGDLEKHFTFKTIHYGIGASISRGLSQTWQTVEKYAIGFSKLFKKETNVNKSLGGIGSFSKIFPTEFDMHDFLMLTAFISVILAFMNLLPIPGLDGGYVVFLLYEMITGRKVNEKVMEIATTVGLILLLGLMVYANGLDIFRAVKGK